MSPVRKYPPGRFLIPARNSRHRTACLALYRAFLRLAPQVSLPDELATGWGPGKNPIAIQIRAAFRRNKDDISPRIVYPALSAGYRMLEVLHTAATNTVSEHYNSVISFLTTRLDERKRSQAKYVPPPPKQDVPRPGTIPLLVNVTPKPTRRNPSPKPEYDITSRPRPLSELGGTGRRQVPRMDMAGEFPFLRFTKPQSKLLSRVLRQKMTKRMDRALRLQEIAEEEMIDARLEDRWDAQVDWLLRREGLPSEDSDMRGFNRWETEAEQQERTHKASFAHNLYQYGVVVLADALQKEREDLIARADAMRALIAKETTLSVEERIQRHEERRARWEAKMLEEHGEKWRDLFPNLAQIERIQKEKIQAMRERAEPVTL